MEENKDEIIFEKTGYKTDDIMLSPYEYFQKVKDKIQKMDDKKLNEIYSNALKLAKLYNRTGQNKGLRKLIFYLKSIMKEKQIIDLGINKFVYKSDIEEYIDHVAEKQCVVLDIASYERVIPEEIVEAMEKVKNLFDEFYIVCTDYNGQLSKTVQKERREKDPILFGAFLDRDNRAINERFYYIGDWIDEYCDLTLDKMVAEMKNKTNKNILKNAEQFNIPQNKDEFTKQLNNLNLKETEISQAKIKFTLISSDKDLKGKKGIFSKIKTFLKKDND